MKSVVGIFRERVNAGRAVASLRAAGIPADRINLLLPEDAGDPVAAGEVATSETEGSGMGKALGGVVGGIAGATAGMGLGVAAATVLIPGVGPVAAVGLAAAALLGVGGAVGGAAAGGALENAMSHGLPKDELYLYEDALRKGHSVVFVLVDDEEAARPARATLDAEGAESIDVARESWWIGLRDAEAEIYEKEGGHFAEDESVFRRGFEAALHPDHRGHSFEQARRDLARSHGPEHETPAFRRGYERARTRARASRL